MFEYIMTPGEFADYIGTDVVSYKGWESNKTRPRLEAAMETAKRLNRKIEDIWYFE